MPDLVAALEWTAKKVLAASDNLAFLVGGLCRTPEPPAPYEDLTAKCDPDHEPSGGCCTFHEPADFGDNPVFSVVDGHGDCVACGTHVFPSPAADSPAVVAAPGPDAQESGRPPRDSANPPAHSAGTPTSPAGTAIVRGDGLREAILAADPHTLRVSAVVGDRCFVLSSWTLRSICSEQVFETSWYEFKPEQHIFEK